MAFLTGLLEKNQALMYVAAVVAFLVAALLILLVFRLAFGRRLRMPGGRSRQPRLGIVDAFDLDAQRQLVLVRRDNVEHLILIGKHTDILIESEIVRADARDLREPRGRDKEFKEPAQLPPMAAQKPVAAADLKMPPLTAEEPAWEPANAAAVAEPAHRPGRIPPMAPSLAAHSERPPVAPLPRRALMPNVAGAKPVSREPFSVEPVAADAERRPVPKPAPSPAPSSPQRPPPITPPTFLRPPPRSPQGEHSAVPPQPAAPTPGSQPAAAPPAPRSSSAAAARGRPPGPAAAGPPVPPPNMLELLEEEMAKLLGRGSDKP